MTAGAGGGLPLRALEGCTSFQTHAVLDMTYYGPLVRRAAEHGVNALAVFVIPDSYYPETSDHKASEYEVELDWPSLAFAEHRNLRCPNAHPDTEYLPSCISGHSAPHPLQMQRLHFRMS